MARKKKQSRLARRPQAYAHTESSYPFGLGESYTSLVLGIIVVIAAALLAVTFIKNRNAAKLNQPTQETSSQSTQKGTEKQAGTTLPATYTVTSGDGLWNIAEKYYKSGYNWVDIAKANSLSEPYILYVGMKLSLPKVEPKLLTVSTTIVMPSSLQTDNNTIAGTSYTVVKGDYLWDIALRAYGDGYKWVEIAKANNLENPDLIFSGNVLKIPR